jgi:hypothetical protein
MNRTNENKSFYYALAAIIAVSALIAKATVLVAGVTV